HLLLLLFSLFHRPSHITIFFLLSIPLPPRSTLFPYTTLFRSQVGGARRREGVHDLVQVQVYLVARALVLRQRELRGIPAPGQDRDRKSTRLNSSHRTISYAVFCLKKKKKK